MNTLIPTLIELWEEFQNEPRYGSNTTFSEFMRWLKEKDRLMKEEAAIKDTLMLKKAFNLKE